MTPCSAQLHPLVDQGHGQAGGAAGQRGPGHCGPAVAVAVGLDHRAQLGRRGQRGPAPRRCGSPRPGRSRPRPGGSAPGPSSPRPSTVGDQRTPHRGASARQPPSAAVTTALSTASATSAGRSPATRPSGRPAGGGPPVHVGGQRGGLDARDAAGAEGPDDAREHVTAARGGQGRAPRRRRAARRAPEPLRRGDRGERPLQQHDGADRGRPGARAAARRSSPGGRAGQAGVLAVVGRQDARGAARVRAGCRAALGVAQRGQGVGVDHQRGPARRRSRRGSPPAGRRPVPSPGPMTTARHLAVASRNGAGPTVCRQVHAHRLGRPGRRRVARGPQPDHAGPGRHGAAGAQHGRSLHARPSRRPRPTAWVHLFACAGRAGSSAAMSASSISSAWAVAEADRRCRPPRPRRTAGPVPLQQAGLEGGEGHRARRPAPRRPGAPAVGVDARGDVDGQDRGAPGDLRRVVGAAEPGAVGAVDHQVARRQRAAAPSPRRRAPPPGRPVGPGRRRPPGRRPRCCPCRPRRRRGGRRRRRAGAGAAWPRRCRPGAPASRATPRPGRRRRRPASRRGSGRGARRACSATTKAMATSSVWVSDRWKRGRAPRPRPVRRRRRADQEGRVARGTRRPPCGAPPRR